MSLTNLKRVLSRSSKTHSVGLNAVKMLAAAIMSCLMMSTGCCKPTSVHQQKKTVGWLEWVKVESAGMPLKAKLDTGALTSSVDTPAYELFDKEGRKWVRFTLGRKKGSTMTLERPVTRFVKIKNKGGQSSERPVVSLAIALGDGQPIPTEVSLADRTRFLYPVLLGRRFIRDAGIAIDPSATYILGRQPIGDNNR